MREIKIGLIGHGFMGKAHVYGIRNAPLYYDELEFKASVEAVAGRRAKAARAFAEALSIPKSSDNYMDIINDRSIDAVLIATPNALHEDMGVAALGAGKHVYIDKPLSTDG